MPLKKGRDRGGIGAGLNYFDLREKESQRLEEERRTTTKV